MGQGTILVLADHRPGNVAQALGVAEALGEPFHVLDVAYDRWGQLPNLVRGAGLLGIAPSTRAALVPPWPRLVIGAGRRTAPLARWFKRHHGAVLVQLMDPGGPGREDFALIAIPLHDKSGDGPNIMRTLGSCHRVTAEKLAGEAAVWAPRLAHLPRPYLTLVVGGATKDRPFTTDQARALIAGAVDQLRETGGSILVTTSPRTPPEIETLLASLLPDPRCLHPWRREGDNPYLGFLALADRIIVTGDSMTMCSEACATQAPVLIFAPPGMTGAKHERLHRELYARGYARPLNDPGPARAHPPLNASAEVAAEIRRRGLLG